jgi:hypothetical protein
LLQAVESRRVDLAIQPGWRPAVHGEEAKESSQRGNLVLESCPAQAPAGLCNVGFDSTGPDTPHGVACFLQVLEETLRGTPVAGNGGGSETPYLAEVIRILFA